MKKFNICGVGVSAINLDFARREFDQWIKAGKKVYVCVAPVSTIVDCQKDAEYRNIVNQADMVTPDGMPTVWLAHLKGEAHVQRTYGPDLMLEICKDGETKNYRHFFYGGTKETCEQLSVKLKEKYPQINIAGSYAPDKVSLYYEEKKDIINQINKSQADILWVGLGSPKQDYWMHRHRAQLDVPVLVGVGAAFDFVAQTKKQAPRWMQRNGLEWFFRLCTEPQRLWKRYLVGNSLFVYYLVCDMFRKKTMNESAV